MPDNRAKTLAEIQEDCLRFAAETGDAEVSNILSRAADDLEWHVAQTGSAPTQH